MTKTILITGSTDGIGKLAAVKLAKEGYELYLHGRNATKLNQVIVEVKAASGNDHIKGFVADFSDLDAVKKMVAQVNEAVGSLDVLINNAGVFKSAAPTTKAGFDIRFVVNYFAPYVLTTGLLPLLEKGKEARIINLSSAAQASVSAKALQGEVSLSAQGAYAQSKLALTMWSFHLAKALSSIHVIAVNPGSLLNTNMVREAYGKFWSSADKGANILYDLAVSPRHKDLTGVYFDNDRGNYGKAHEDAYDADAIADLIEQTEVILKNN